MENKLLENGNGGEGRRGGGEGEKGATVQNGRSIFFVQSFVKSRPIKTRRSERVPLQIVSLKTPKMTSHFGMSSKAQ